MKLTNVARNRLLLVFIPILFMDIIIRAICFFRMGDMDLYAAFNLLDDPYLFQLPDMPHNFLVLPVLFLLTEAVWLWFIEKDILFTKILTVKALLFAILGYGWWYGFLFFDTVSERTFIFYIHFVTDFLLTWYLVIANVALFIMILLKSSPKD